MPKVAVIVPAAGQSKRFGGDEKKPFAKLDGRPIFLRTLELFINRPDVCQTLLVVAPEDAERVKTRFGANLGFMGVKLVMGGAERADSVANALEHVSEQAELVAVHDAVRPCATEAMIDAVIAEAAKSGAAILAAPIRGTLKSVAPTRLVEQTLSRSGIWEAQTPQVFRRELLLSAYGKRGNIKGPITDDAAIVEAVGHPVRVVESDFTNIKITTTSDVALASAILRSRPKPKPVGPRGPFEEAQW